MYRRGQASLITVMILVAFALILGTALATYFTSTLNNYRVQVDILDTLNYEATHISLKPLATVNETQWVSLKRLDNTRKPFFIAVQIEDSGTYAYVSCNDVLIYNYTMDRDGIMCSEDNDCTPSTPIIVRGSVYVLGDNGVATYDVYAKLRGLSPTPPSYICRVPSFEPNSTIISISIGSAKQMYIHIATVIDNVPYIVKTYKIVAGTAIAIPIPTVTLPITAAPITTTTIATTTRAPTVTIPQTRTAVATTTAISPRVSLVISVYSDWGTGINVGIDIKNTGSSPITNWRLTIRMSSQITSMWNANYQYLGNNLWLIIPLPWSSTIYPGSTINIGFIANKQGDLPYPEVISFEYT